MRDLPKRIADVLLAVEATLRSSGTGELQSRRESVLLCSQPFCMDISGSHSGCNGSFCRA